MSNIDLDYISSLFQSYSSDLTRVRETQRRFHYEAGYPHDDSLNEVQKFFTVCRRGIHYLKHGAVLKPQLDDLEAEITYLLLRDTCPQTVVEVSPCGGWSTSWILQALADNGQGNLHSFDIVDFAPKNVPTQLPRNRWQFHLGDVTKNVDKIPEGIDYLFVDSDHSSEFADWYIENLFPKLGPGAMVSVHDVYHTAEPDGYFPEGKTIVDWLAAKQIPFFSASKAGAPASYLSLTKVKEALKMTHPIHRDDRNSMIFFQNPGRSSLQ